MKVSGSAGLGLQYSADVAAGVAKTKVLNYMTVNFGGAAETDNGLSMSASTAYKVTNNGAGANDDTTISISGAFGKLSMGAVGEADVQGGLADIGFDGIGIDNLAESLDGAVAHNVNYSYAAGNLSMAISGKIGAASGVGASGESYAFGGKYSANGMYVGLGYSVNNATSAKVATEGTTTSVYAGGTVQDVALNAMYSSFNPETTAASTSAFGVNAAYTMGASTFSVGYSQADTNTAKEKGIYGVGVAYDFGGGAAFKAGIGSVRKAADATKTSTVADMGVTFSF